MQLTYRGVNYQSQPAETEVQNTDMACKYRLSYHPDANKIVWIRKMHYYTYRGVSYAKYSVVNADTKILGSDR
jgi:hypothetical protein